MSEKGSFFSHTLHHDVILVALKLEPLILIRYYIVFELFGSPWFLTCGISRDEQMKIRERSVSNHLCN